MVRWNPGDPLTDADIELLQPLIDKAQEIGMTPTTREIPTSAKIKSRFRLWKYAVMAAGLPSLNSTEQIQIRQARAESLKSTQPDEVCYEQV